MTKSVLTCASLRGIWGQMDCSAIWVSWSDEFGGDSSPSQPPHKIATGVMYDCKIRIPVYIVSTIIPNFYDRCYVKRFKCSIGLKTKCQIVN